MQKFQNWDVGALVLWRDLVWQKYHKLFAPKKKAFVGAANQVFVVVAKYTGTAPTAPASGKLAAKTVTQIKVLVVWTIA
jgi:hypothetical protein